jgi:hypothetical protein
LYPTLLTGSTDSFYGTHLVWGLACLGSINLPSMTLLLGGLLKPVNQPAVKSPAVRSNALASQHHVALTNTPLGTTVYITYA